MVHFGRSVPSCFGFSSGIIILVLGTVHALDCTVLPAYSPGSYEGGDVVVNQDAVFECKPWPYTGWCGGAASFFEPGIGSHWRDAWNDIGQCTNSSRSGEVPSTRSIVSISWTIETLTSSSQSSTLTSSNAAASKTTTPTTASPQEETTKAQPSTPTALRSTTPVTPRPADASKCPNGLLDGSQDCRSTPHCCASGQCYEKNEWWGSCKMKCTKGEKDGPNGFDDLPWSCVNLSAAGPSPPAGQPIVPSTPAMTSPPPAATSSSAAQPGGSMKPPPGGPGGNVPEICRGRGNDQSSYAFEDDVPPSQYSPLDKSDTPQFVALSFDDNSHSGLDGTPGGMDWLTSMLAGKLHSDGDPVRATFFHTSIYISDWMAESPVNVKRSWRKAFNDGHEVGLHSHSHPHGRRHSEKRWSKELSMCRDWITKPFDPNESSPNKHAGIGVPPSQIFGSRTPFLEYNDNMMSALVDLDILYDSSIEEGWQLDHVGTNFFWPYTLDRGRAGFFANPAILPQPGLYELPVHPLIVPPDDEIGQYGIDYSLRDKCKGIASWFDSQSGKITGFDYNMWVQFKMTGKEFLATLKYNLDLRLEGNLAPFMPGFHSDYYSDKYTAPNAWASPSERRQALEDFIEYALSKPEVRLVPMRDIVGWMRDPVPKGCLGA